MVDAQRHITHTWPAFDRLRSATTKCFCGIYASVVWNELNMQSVWVFDLKYISIHFWWEVVKHKALSMLSSAMASINYLWWLHFGYLRMTGRFGTYVFIKKYSDLVILPSWLLLNKKCSKTGRQTKERLSSGAQELHFGRHRRAGIKTLFQKQGEKRRAYKGKEETPSKAT